MTRLFFNPQAFRQVVDADGRRHKAIASDAGIDPAIFSQLYNGRAKLKGPEAKRLAETLATSVDLLGFDHRGGIAVNADFPLDRSDADDPPVAARLPSFELTGEQRKTIAWVAAEAQRTRTNQLHAVKAAKPKKTNPKRKEGAAKAMATREAKEYLAKVWYEELGTVFGVSVTKPAWSQGDGAKITALLQFRSLDDLEGVLRYTVRNWKEIGARYFKDRSTPLPTIAFVSSFVDNMVQEAQSAPEGDLSALKDEWDAWHFDHPFDPPPEDLQRRYDEAKPRLQALRLKKK